MALEWHVGNAGLGTYYRISAHVPLQVPVKFGGKPWRLATVLPLPQWLWVWHLPGAQQILVKWINKWIESKGLVYRRENQGSEESRGWSRSCVKCVGHSGPWVPVHWSLSGDFPSVPSCCQDNCSHQKDASVLLKVQLDVAMIQACKELIAQWQGQVLFMLGQLEERPPGRYH